MKAKTKSSSDLILERVYSKRQSKRTLEQYQKALIKYPDLKHLPVKLAVLVYKFREELIQEYVVDHTSETKQYLRGMKIAH